MTTPPSAPDQLPRNRKAIVVASAAAVALVLVVLTLALRRCGGGDQAPVPAATVDSAVASAPADAAPSPPSLASPPSPARVDASTEARARGRLITERELRALQRRHRRLLQFCYERAARQGSWSVPRKAPVVVELGEGGRVTSVQVEAGDDRQLEACLRRVVGAWRFAPSLRAQRVAFPVVFLR